MERHFLKDGLFSKKFMNSRICENEMTVKEKILGYLIGPFGMLALQAVVNQLAELYYTEIFYIDELFGVGTYLIMSWVTKITSMLSGLLVAYLVEHSSSSQGKVRPLVFIGSLISIIGAFFMFYIPPFADIGKMVWIYIFNILYNGIGASMFALRTNMITLATRNQKDRNIINLLDRISSYMLVGTAVTMVVGSILYYTSLHNQPAVNWITLIGMFCLLAFVLSFINYFYTKERLTLENEDVEGAIHNRKNGFSTFEQLKCLFKSKYWVMAFLITLIMQICANMQGYNMNTNFCTLILGATAENNYNLFYTIASGVPLGIGILIIYPIAKKITIRKTTILFSIIAIAGALMAFIVKGNFIPAIIANFLFNFGTLPGVYIIQSLLYSANDEVEYKYHFRPEGTLALAITVAAATIISGLFAGVYETGLSMNGYNATLGTAQPEGVINWIQFTKCIVPLIQYVVIIIIMVMMNLEEKLPQMQKEIEERKAHENNECTD